MCGEKWGSVHFKPSHPGSPPRVRGEGKSRSRKAKRTRITPACAGRSLPRSHRRALPRDHPRVCGEKFEIKVHSSRRTGSPPRVRGEGLRPELVVKEDRITPACAGRRIWQKSTSLSRTDHPRVCGEKSNGRRGPRPSLGSPPRVRGEVFLELQRMYR